MSTVHLPDELAAGALADRFPAAGVERDQDDPLEAFIGSGHSGRGDLARRHREILAEELAGKSAADL